MRARVKRGGESEECEMDGYTNWGRNGIIKEGIVVDGQ